MHALRIARTKVAIARMRRAAKAVLDRILAAFAFRSTPRSAPRVEGARAVKRRGRTPIMYAP
jgi:hypothetical protein